MPRHGRDDGSTARSRELRRDSTPPERLLWNHLRNRQLDGLKFRRQYPLGRYVCDFYCDEARLVIEVDGRVHESRQAADAERDRAIEVEGVRALRVSASWIVTDIDAVLRLIRSEAEKRV